MSVRLSIGQSVSLCVCVCLSVCVCVCLSSCLSARVIDDRLSLIGTMNGCSLADEARTVKCTKRTTTTNNNTTKNQHG